MPENAAKIPEKYKDPEGYWTGIDVDFAGSAGVVQLGINVPLCYTEAYTSFGVKCIVAPHVPNNAASLATIRPNPQITG